MNEIIIYLAIFITGFIIIELIVRNIVKSINRDFQWLIIEKDEAPKLSKQGLRKFLLQFNAFAISRAVVVFPTPRIPVRR